MCAGLQARCVAELNEVLEEVETHIRLLSEELLEQLALRDELTFHKEASNTFISALMALHTLLKEQQRRRRSLQGRPERQQGSVRILLRITLTLSLGSWGNTAFPRHPVASC